MGEGGGGGGATLVNHGMGTGDGMESVGSPRPLPPTHHTGTLGGVEFHSKARRAVIMCSKRGYLTRKGLAMKLQCATRRAGFWGRYFPSSRAHTSARLTCSSVRNITTFHLRFLREWGRGSAVSGSLVP